MNHFDWVMWAVALGALVFAAAGWRLYFRKADELDFSRKVNKVLDNGWNLAKKDLADHQAAAATQRELDRHARRAETADAFRTGAMALLCKLGDCGHLLYPLGSVQVGDLVYTWGDGQYGNVPAASAVVEELQGK